MTEPDLIEHIDRLTKPNRTKIIQDAEPHPKTVTIVLPPLLTQLQEAVRGTVGIGGSGSLPSERNLLDSDALHRFLTIKSLIRDWALAVKAEVRPEDPAATLRAWYVRWSEKPREVAETRFYVGKTGSWITQIEAKLDPPRIRELPDRCPACDAFTWWNPADRHEYQHPLIVEYRPTGPTMVEDAVARCRACEASWGVRAMAYELEQQLLRDWDGAIAEDATRRVVNLA